MRMDQAVEGVPVYFEGHEGLIEGVIESVSGRTAVVVFDPPYQGPQGPENKLTCTLQSLVQRWPMSREQFLGVIRTVSEAPVPKEEPDSEPRIKAEGVHDAAVVLGKLGGAKGGPARAAKLSHEQRSRIAREAARKRWARGKGPEAQPTPSEPLSPTVGGELAPFEKEAATLIAILQADIETEKQRLQEAEGNLARLEGYRRAISTTLAIYRERPGERDSGD